jgi:hypothetical protein
LRPGTARATRAGVRDGITFRLTIGLGEVTVISGSGVDDGGGAASCDIALLPNPHSTSQLAPPILRARRAIDVIVPILKSFGRIRHRQRIRKLLAVAMRRTNRFRLIPRESPTLGDPLRDDRSMSGDRGSARLKRDAAGVEMDELGVGGQV